jgi:hypothetical protein
MGLAHAHRSNAQAKVRAEPPMPQGRCERPRQCQLLKQSRSWWMAKTEIHPDPVEGTAVAATGADADNRRLPGSRSRRTSSGPATVAPFCTR